MTEDVRWHQRFSNYRKALKKLSQAIYIITLNNTNDIDDEDMMLEIEQVLKEGLIQRFEYTHELAWNVMKDFAEYQGNSTIKGSRDATREAFKMQLLGDAEIWMDMLKSRNITSHTYIKETAEEIYLKIVNQYYSQFILFEKIMEELRIGKQGTIFDKEL